MTDKSIVRSIEEQFKNADIETILQYLNEKYPGKIAFSSSFSAEDQIITYYIARSNLNIRIFLLDTGRLFYETYDLLEQTKARYNLNIEVFFPDNHEVEEMVNKKGLNLFYESIENRKLCCTIRKINPLKRALSGMKVWITGIRKEQSVTRKNMKRFEWDDEFQMIKFNPLIEWNDEKVWEFIHTHKIPYNPLHDKGYLSIGCAPCTRAVEKGEPARNGRWWWENPETKECGLHAKVRNKSM